MRIVVLKYILTAFLIVLLLGLFYTQIIQGNYYVDLSENNRIRLQLIKAPRGRILDRSGRILAGNRPSYNIYVVPRDFDKNYVPWLESAVGMPPGALIETLATKKMVPYMPNLLQQDVSKEVVFRVEEKKPELTGVNVEIEGRRFYPYESHVGHVTGFIGRVSKTEFSEGEGKYSRDDFIGRAGIEKTYDDVLRGEDGGRQVEVNSRGEVIRVLGVRKPKSGEDVTLSLDIALQEMIWEIIKDYDENLSVAILDLKTNEIVALVSKPAYDPNIFVSGGKAKERLDVFKDTKHPILNRPVSVGYPPGSVFKLITGMGGLESGKTKPESSFTCGGTFSIGGDHLFHCWNKNGHGTLGLHDALVQSCNVYFYNVGRIIGENVISKTARLFGLDEKPGVELPMVFGGVIPDNTWKMKRFRDKWYKGETISYAIGQGYLLLSPVQVLRMVSAYAKDGFLPWVTIIKGNGGRDRRVPVEQKHLRVIQAAMRDVVQSDYGTGKAARVPFMEVAAKTGSAQNPQGKSHAWFAGYFPYKNPRYSIVCMIEQGGAGGAVAGALAREIMTMWNEKKGLNLA